MKPESKRKTTHQGLGGLGGPSEEPRSAEGPPSARPAFAADDEPVESGRKSRTPTLTGAAVATPQPSTAPQPSAAPSVSAVPPSRGTAQLHSPASHGASPFPRHTRNIEATPPAPPSRSNEPPSHPPLDTKPPTSQPIERVERVERAERADPTGPPSSSRTPIDVTHVDTARLQNLSSDRPRSGASRPTSARPVPASTPRPDSRYSATPASASGRPRTASPSPRTASPSPRTASPSPRSGRPAGSPGGSPAVSKRPSIRQEDVGTAVRRIRPPAAGPGAIVPRLLLSEAEIAAAPIDHRAGFLLAHIDGVTSVQGLVDIAGMGEEEVHEILDRLRRLGIVAIR